MKLTGFFVILFLKILDSYCTHLKGTWSSEDFVLFLLKFGFQKTDSHDPYSSGFVYGNITTDNSKLNKSVAFVLFDYDHFYHFYTFSKLSNKENACQSMFRCDDDNQKYFNYVADVPCPANGICKNSKKPLEIVRGSQFSFQIKDLQYPTYRYASFAACYRNAVTCSWHHFPDKFKIDYDIWFVNGNPNRSSFNPFTYQFSFDKQDTVEFYLLFFIIYALLVPVQVYAASHQKHPVTRLFTSSLFLEFFGVLLNLLNSLKFAVDGEGLPYLAVIGDVLDILSRTTFMLLLLLLAKGWAVTRIQLSWRPFVFFIWLLYGVVHILLYIWNLTEVNIVEEIDEYETWPGYLILILRMFIIVWFVLELKNTMKYEHNKRKLNFFLHFGASALVWFIYLPIVALVSLNLSSLWRYKLLLGVTYAADCLAYCIMTHLLWPTRSEQYFLLANSIDSGGDELDVFNEAPHVLNSYVPASPVLSDSSQYMKLIDLNNYS